MSSPGARASPLGESGDCRGDMIGKLPQSGILRTIFFRRSDYGCEALELSLYTP